MPAATSTASARERSAENSRLSALPPSPPDRPATVVAPSTLAIMLSRTEGTAARFGQVAVHDDRVDGIDKVGQQLPHGQARNAA